MITYVHWSESIAKVLGATFLTHTVECGL